MRERRIKVPGKLGVSVLVQHLGGQPFAMVVVYSQSMPSGLMNKEQNVLL